MAISRLNHAVLFVRDLQRSVDFYTDVMGFRVVPMLRGFKAAFLRRGHGGWGRRLEPGRELTWSEPGEGVEPSTSALQERRSGHLSYPGWPDSVTAVSGGCRW